MCCKIRIFCVCKVRNCEARQYFTSLLVLIFWGVAGCSIGLGVYILVVFNVLLHDGSMQTTVALLIGFGVILFILGQFFCCWLFDEVCSESESDRCCMQFMAGVAITMIIAAMIAVAVKTLSQKSEIFEAIDGALTPVFDKYDGKSTLSHDVDTFQKKFHCCGFTGLDDFENKAWALKNGSKWPDSCCQVSYDGCSMNDTLSYWNQTCRDVIERDFVNNLKYVGAVAMCIIVFVVVSCSIACFCRNNRINCKYPRTNNDFGMNEFNYVL